MLLLMPPPDSIGPSLPAAQMLPRISALPFWSNGTVVSPLKDIPSAVVVVEEDGIQWLAPPGGSHPPAWVVRVRKAFHMWLFGPQSEFSPASYPPGMDPWVTTSGGNVVGRTYALGGVRF